MVRIDPESGRVVDSIELTRPNVVEVGFGAVWVTNNQANIATVVRIDPASRVPVPIPIGPAVAINPDDLAVGAGAVWALLGDAVYRIDPDTDRVRGKVSGLAVGNLLGGIVAGAGSVWVADSTDGAVARIDPRTDRVVDTADVGSNADQIALGEGAVWITSAVARTVTRLDPQTGRIVSVVSLPGVPGGIAAGEGAVWITDPDEDRLMVLDTVTGRIELVRVGDGPTGVAVGEGSVWVTNTRANTVSRIDSETRNVVAVIDVPGDPYSVAVGDGAVWVTLLRRSSGE